MRKPGRATARTRHAVHYIASGLRRVLQAGRGQARAGCYLNNTAVAAAAALAAGAPRVLILDWDVAHCQGTAEIFAGDPRVMVVSMHRFDR